MGGSLIAENIFISFDIIALEKQTFVDLTVEYGDVRPRREMNDVNMSIEKMLNLFFNIVALKQICVYHALLLAARAFNVWRKKHWLCAICTKKNI